MRRIGLFPALLFLFTSLLAAQGYKGQGKVLGYVTDEAGNPIEGVKIKLYAVKAQSGFETTTDEKGKWRALYIRGGLWNIDFEKSGYEPRRISIELKEFDRNPDIEIRLKKIEGLVITDELKDELREGNNLFDQKKYKEAVEAYNKIIEKFPDVYIIYMNIGNCYFELEKYIEAEEYYMKVMDKDPQNQEAMLLIGNTYANRGEKEKALEWYNKIEFEKITDPIVLFNMGTNFVSQSNHEQALKYYQRAVELKPDFPDAVYQLGLVNLTLGRSPEAIAAFERYLAIDPDSERANQVKSFLEFLKKK